MGSSKIISLVFIRFLSFSLIKMVSYIQLTFLSVVSSVIYHLIMKRMDLDGYDSALFLIWLHVVMIGFLTLRYWNNDPKNFVVFDRKILTDTRFIMLVVVGGFMSYITHYYGYGVAFLKFRNPGYFQAIMGLELVGITVFATLLFGSDIGIKEIIGILFILLGSVIITWTEKKSKSIMS